MGASDWTELSDGEALTSSDVKRGVTSAIARPNGGGNFVFGFNSVNNVVGVAGLFANQAGFATMAYGAVVTACMMRGTGAYTTGFSPYIFVGAANGESADFGYLLGLANADPYHIVLRKGRLSDGLPDTVPTLNVDRQPNGCNMRRSTATFSPATWLQLMLNVAVNANNDIVISCKRNNLDDNPCTAPVWEDIPGMAPVVDDALEDNTGSTPLIEYGVGPSKAGMACYVSGISRRAYFDQFTLRKQNP
jgi:hypothetical protein